MTPAATSRLVILYGIGGLSDVGRHAILAALEQPSVQHITVITEYPELLEPKNWYDEDSNWQCGCPTQHTNPTTDASTKDRIELVKIDSWKNPQKNLAQHFKKANAVISCLGHRQPGKKYPALIERGLVAADGNRQVIEAMKEAKVERAVVMSSAGVQEDWPPFEFFCMGRVIMSILFKTNTKGAFDDLTAMEVAYKESDLDYLFLRPGGLGEDVVPVNSWQLQKKKYEDKVGLDLAKLDCARYMVQEALHPTKHRCGVVIGSKEKDSNK